MEKFEIGDSLTVIKTDPLPGNQVAPPLEKEKSYKVEDIFLDKGETNISMWGSSQSTTTSVPTRQRNTYRTATKFIGVIHRDS